MRKFLLFRFCSHSITLCNQWFLASHLQITYGISLYSDNNTTIGIAPSGIATKKSTLSHGTWESSTFARIRAHFGFDKALNLSNQF
jgi:hypothetical protein